MNDHDAPRPRGPWDPPSAPAPEPGAARDGFPRPKAASSPLVPPAEDRGQPLGWAILSTLLLGGFIWWLSNSWIVAVAAIWGLFVHEYGHVLAMNRLGMGPARIYIIPFLGGLAKGQREPASEWHGVIVSLAGPLFGLLAALPFFLLYLTLGGAAWLFGAAVVALINLVNLAPAPPLDGSRALGPVLARIHPRLELAVIAAIGGLVVWWGLDTGRYILAAFLAIALIGHLKRGVVRPLAQPLTGTQSVMSVGLFLGAAAACVAVGLAAVLPLVGGDPAQAVALGRHYLGL